LARRGGIGVIAGDEGTDGAIRKVHESSVRILRNILSGPVQQSGELAGALPHDGERNLGADGRAHHAFCGGTGDERDVCGNDAAAERVESRDSLREFAAGCVLFMGWKAGSTWRPRFVRRFYDDKLADENLEVSTEEGYRLVKRLAREEGLLVSPSAAAALLGCFGDCRVPSKEKESCDRDRFRGFGGEVFERRFLGEE